MNLNDNQDNSINISQGNNSRAAGRDYIENQTFNNYYVQNLDSELYERIKNIANQLDYVNILIPLLYNHELIKVLETLSSFNEFDIKYIISNDRLFSTQEEALDFFDNIILASRRSNIELLQFEYDNLIKSSFPQESSIPKLFRLKKLEKERIEFADNIRKKGIEIFITFLSNINDKDKSILKNLDLLNISN